MFGSMIYPLYQKYAQAFVRTHRIFHMFFCICPLFPAFPEEEEDRTPTALRLGIRIGQNYLRRIADSYHFILHV